MNACISPMFPSSAPPPPPPPPPPLSLPAVAYLKGLLTPGEVPPAARQHRDRMLSRVVVTALQRKVDAAAGSFCCCCRCSSCCCCSCPHGDSNSAAKCVVLPPSTASLWVTTEEGFFHQTCFWPGLPRAWHHPVLSTHFAMLCAAPLLQATPSLR